MCGVELRILEVGEFEGEIDSSSKRKHTSQLRNAGKHSCHKALVVALALLLLRHRIRLLPLLVFHFFMV